MAIRKEKVQKHEDNSQRKSSVRIGIFGASGSGKTTKARELTRKLGRIVYFDTVHEFCKTEKGVKVFHALEDLKKALIKDFAKGFRFVFCPTYGAWEAQLDEVSKFLTHIQSGYHSGLHRAQLTFVVDELSRSFPSGIRQRNPQHGFGFLCCMGRHYGINIVGISQRIPQVDAEFRSNLTSVYYFRLAELIDLSSAIKVLGSEWGARLRNLPNFKYICKTETKIFTG